MASQIQSKPLPRAVLLLALLCIAGSIIRAPQGWDYDSVVVYAGIRELIHWWVQGRQRALLDIGPFAPFQYLTGFPFVLLGYAGVPVDTYRMWAWINTAGFCGMAWILFRVARELAGSAVAWAMVVVMFCGPFLVYTTSTMNESVAALITLAFAAAATGRGGAVACAALCWLGGITKETAPPLLAIIWLGGIWMRRFELGRRGIVRHAIALCVAIVFAVACNSALNLLRYGSLLNPHYLSDELHVHNLAWRVEYCLALWLAPNGGVLFFWPTFFAMFFGTIALAMRRPEVGMPLLIASVVLALMTIGLSGWYTPFGWWCWGPRLLLPWLPAALLLALRGSPVSFQRFTQLVLAPRGAFIVVATLLPILALPHVLKLYDTWIGIGQFFDQPEPTNLNPPDDIKELGHARISYEAWQKWTPLMWRPIWRISEPHGAASAVTYGLALVLLLWQARAMLPNLHAEAPKMPINRA